MQVKIRHTFASMKLNFFYRFYFHATLGPIPVRKFGHGMSRPGPQQLSGDRSEKVTLFVTSQDRFVYINLSIRPFNIQKNIRGCWALMNVYVHLSGRKISKWAFRMSLGTKNTARKVYFLDIFSTHFILVYQNPRPSSTVQIHMHEFFQGGLISGCARTAIF